MQKNSRCGFAIRGWCQPNFQVATEARMCLSSVSQKSILHVLCLPILLVGLIESGYGDFPAATESQSSILRSQYSEFDGVRVSTLPVASDLAGDQSPRGLSEVDILILELQSEDAEARSEAAAKLGWIGDEARAALPTLTTILNDEDPLVRAHAATAIWEIGRRTRKAVPVLADLLVSTYPGVSTLAAYSLGRIGPAAGGALSSLRQAMDSSSEFEQIYFAEAILKINPDDQYALETLLFGLRHHRNDVRVQAVLALGEINLENRTVVIPALLSAANDEDEQVRTTAQMVLSSLVPDSTGRVTIALAEEELHSSVRLTHSERVTMFEQTFGRSAPGKSNSSRFASRTIGELPEVGGLLRASFNQAPNLPQAYNENINVTPIGELTTDIVPSEGEFPPNYAASQLGDLGTVPHTIGTSRTWDFNSYEWEAPGLWHRPVYLEETNAERYGNTFGVFHPMVSMGLFYARMPMFPYKMALHHPREPRYELGFYRPGSYSPYQLSRFPVKLWPITWQGLVTTGMIFAIP